MKIRNVVQLPHADAGLQHSIVRLHNSNIDARRLDRLKFFRREPVIIRNPATGAKVMRYVMGTAGGLSVTKASIAVDYDAVDALNVRFKEPVVLEIRRARALEVYQWFWRHPDLSVRLSIRLGLMGTVLGLMGLLTGVMGILPLLIRWVG